MDRNNLLTKLLMAVLILMLLGGIALGVVHLLSMEGQEPPEPAYRQSLSQRPKGKEEIPNYLNSCVDYAVSQQVKLDVGTDVLVDDDSISFGENGELLKKSFRYAKKPILDKLAKDFGNTSVNFGQDFTEELWNLHFAPDLIAGVYSEVDEELYTFRISFPDETNPFGMNGLVNETFHMADSEVVLNTLWESYKGFALIENVAVTCTGLQITASVNRLTDEIATITYTKKLNIKADITFLGELADVGSRGMSFIMEEKTNFNFTWANLTLTPNTLKLEKGDIKVIGAIVTASDDTRVQWSSSNPAVASVDDQGYVKAQELSSEPIIITAEFEFLGKKYTDTCVVTVTIPVKRVNISARRLTLAAGEEKTLQANVKPSDATIQDVLWRSENPAVVTVDSHGKVIGVAAGTTEIVVLSKDGYYKTTCAVTVTE